MKAASINSVYSLVKNVANSQNRGYATPAEFNSFAVNSQQELFQEMLASYDDILRKQRGFISHSEGAYDGIEHLEDDLRNLLRVDVPLTGTDNVMTLPEDHAYLLSLSANDRKVDNVPPEKSRLFRSSFLAAPTEDRAVAVVERNQITFYPDTLDSSDNLTITYYKYPQGTDAVTGLPSTSNPSWGFTTVSDVAIYNPSASIDFELPKSLEYRLAQKVLSYLGINMREAEIVQFAQLKEQEETMNNQ